jgi:hypothetical protein
MSARRIVQFVVTSTVWTGAQLLQRLGPADEPVETFGDTVGRPGAFRLLDKSAWVVSSGVSETRAVEDHLAALYEKVRPVVSGSDSSDVMLVASILRIVQYLPSNESQGHGFTIGSEWIEILSAFNGVVDIDQYVIADPDF